MQTHRKLIEIYRRGQLHILEIKGHPFRELADTDSGDKRTVIPFFSGQAIRE
jgi:hypothetical protein